MPAFMENLMSSFTSYAFLFLAIIIEVIATMFLGKSYYFTRLIPSLLSGILYACSFYLLAQVLRNLPLSIAYASWGGLGIILTTIVGIVVFKQKPDAAAIAGIALIVAGVVVVNGFSKMSVH